MRFAYPRLTVVLLGTMPLWMTLTLSAVGNDSDRARPQNAATAATLTVAHRQTAPTPDSGRPMLRRSEPAADVNIFGPDPESFDRDGLETWWRTYQEHRQAE